MIHVQLWKGDTLSAEQMLDLNAETEVNLVLDRIISEAHEGRYGEGVFTLMADRVTCDQIRGFQGVYWHSPPFTIPREKAAS